MAPGENISECAKNLLTTQWHAILMLNMQMFIKKRTKTLVDDDGKIAERKKNKKITTMAVGGVEIFHGSVAHDSDWIIMMMIH